MVKQLKLFNKKVNDMESQNKSFNNKQIKILENEHKIKIILKFEYYFGKIREINLNFDDYNINIKNSFLNLYNKIQEKTEKNKKIEEELNKINIKLNEKRINIENNERRINDKIKELKNNRKEINKKELFTSTCLIAQDLQLHL